MKKALIILAIFGALVLVAKNDHGTTFLGANLFSGTNTVGAGGSFVTSGGGTIAATTAAAFAATPSKCSAGNYPLGVAANGDAVDCTAAGAGSDYPAATELHLIEEFFHPSTTTATMGWSWANGTTTTPASEANHHGIVRRLTGSGGSGVNAYLSKSASTSINVLPSDTFNITWIVRPNTDSSQVVRVGFSCSSLSSAQPASGLYFEATDSGNWFAVNRNASTETGTNQDTTIDLAAGTWYRLGIRRSGSNAIFSINGTDRITQSANFPTAVCNPWTVITNTAVEDKTLDHDLMYLKITVTR